MDRELGLHMPAQASIQLVTNEQQGGETTFPERKSVVAHAVHNSRSRV